LKTTKTWQKAKKLYLCFKPFNADNLQYRYDVHKKEKQLMHEDYQKLINYLEEEKKKGLVSLSWTLTEEQATRLTPQIAKEMLLMLTAPSVEDPDLF